MTSFFDGHREFLMSRMLERSGSSSGNVCKECSDISIISRVPGSGTFSNLTLVNFLMCPDIDQEYFCFSLIKKCKNKPLVIGN